MTSPNSGTNGVPLTVFSGGYDSYVIENPTVMKWMAENNVQYNHSLFQAEMTDPAAVAARKAKLQTVIDYGIPVWIEFETCFENAGFTFTISPNTQPFTDTLETTTSPYSGYPVGTPLPSWNTMFGAAVDEYNTLDIKGFSSEGGFDNGLIWITTKEHAVGKEFSWFSWGPTAQNQTANTPPVVEIVGASVGPYIFWTAHDLGWWCSHADEIVWECYSTLEFTWTTPACQWVQNNCSIRQGIATYFSPPGTLTNWSYYLEDSGSVVPDNIQLPLMEQQKLAARYLNQLKTIVGHFDVVEILATDPTYPNNTIQEQGEFMMGLNLTTAGTKQVQSMSQSGLVPYYTGASPYCSHTSQPDSFTNTGSEIIMLKSTGSATHTITVTGTSATKNYTLTVDPNVPSFLGPYPIATFGSMPTITYDNTNLYVSIINDMPYGA